MKLQKPSLIAAATVVTSLLLTPLDAFGAATGEKTPLNLKDAPATGGGQVAGGG
ncbi:MAG: hypothetical protein QOG46_2341, partial [Pseudonocardiales bacterium]|nr:hypothetical protein [Pseudonocardiales bacterium]